MHLSATAVVFVNIAFAEITQRFWEEIYQDAGVNYVFFESEEQTRVWLQSVLKSATNNNLVHQSSTSF
ncbi:hypothetical protein [Paraglaciecola sp. MB-3u-78]|uniref:hypothetical protein n=1 Tax=Paraglaciecola sp. MB-3u-78 TaxID=2058332 RepID=UPI000C31EBE5|nr:hypothetical protein [Paraglaciecola sp. MB-3u-78]PKH00066.1 hypothetical protein CXF95_05365 [Paraglaciecola sp. MB-3u-78]